MQSLAPFLTLILITNHLANMPQQTTSTLFGLTYQVATDYFSCEYSIDDLAPHCETITYEYSTHTNSCETNYLWIFNRRCIDDVMQHKPLWKKRIPFQNLVRWGAPWRTPLLWSQYSPACELFYTPCSNKWTAFSVAMWANDAHRRFSRIT